MMVSRFAAVLALLALPFTLGHGADRYRVEAVWIESSQNADKPMNPVGSIVSPQNASWITAKLADPKANPVLLPVVEVYAGVKTTVSAQTDFKYPSAYDAGGNATEFATRKVGPAFTVTVTPTGTASAHIDIAVENPKFVKYETPPNVPSGVKQPVFSSGGPTSHTDLHDGYWVTLGAAPSITTAGFVPAHSTPGDPADGFFALRVTKIASP